MAKSRIEGVVTSALYAPNPMSLSIATESVLETFGLAFSTYASSIDVLNTSIMTLTIGSANSDLVIGDDKNIFNAPNGSGGYTEYIFYKINIVE
ncbi:MAG: hypothetical protein SNG27_08600 [Rikenellaceae bacterium]